MFYRCILKKTQNLSLANSFCCLVLLCVLFLFSSCSGLRNRGWAVDFSPKLDPGRFENYNSGFALDFKTHTNQRRNNKNNGWAVDFKPKLSPNRFETFNSGFYVIPKSNYNQIKLSGSFNVAKKKNQGGFEFSKKSRSVKAKRSLFFNKRPRTNDSFGSRYSKKESSQLQFNKRKRRVTKKRFWFKKRKKEKLYKRKKNMELDLFPSDVRRNT